MAQTLNLDVDQATLTRARLAAHSRGQTLEELVTGVVRDLVAADRGAESGASNVTTHAQRNGMLGLFADDPDLVDQVLESAMAAREQDPLRATS
jgi:hypothetical protein